MKKATLVLLIFTCILAGAQQFTPNLQLQIPPRGATNWDATIGNDFRSLDTVIGILLNPFQGVWNSGQVYSRAQQVSFGSQQYISLTAGNLGNNPSTSPTVWQLIQATALPHSILSPIHSDTTVGTLARGDGFFVVGAGLTWQRVAHPTASGGYFKWNGTDIIGSTLAAPGVGTCAGQVVTGLNADALPTCTSLNLTSSFFASQSGSLTNTVLHGNPSGNLNWGFVSMITDVSGVLAVQNGGTGIGSAISVPADQGQINATLQTADIASTTLYAMTAGNFPVDVECYEIVFLPAGTTSTLPAITVGWTDGDNSVAQTVATASNTGNSTSTLLSGRFVIYPKVSTNVTVSTVGYASNPANAMKFSLRCRATPHQ